MDWLFLVLLGTISLLYAIIEHPGKAFLNIYITVLFLSAQIFRARIPGLPELNFQEIAIIPIFIVALFTDFSRWRFTTLSYLVIAMMIARIYSEYYNWGEKEALNITAYQLADVFAPFALAKLLIVPRGLTVKFARRIVFLTCIAIVLSLYEFIFWGNPFVMIPQRLAYYDQGYEWPLLLRYGFKRIGSSFVQPILFGIGISIALFFNYWLVKNKLWSNTFRLNPFSFPKKGVALMVILIIGLIATFSRGPIYSTLLGFMLVGIGFSKSRVKSLVGRLLLIGGGLLIGWGMVQYYTTLNKELSEETVGSAQYRIDLLTHYMDAVYQHPWFGWGRDGVKIIGGQKSIDNEYLLTALRHGAIALFFEVVIMLYACYLLIRRGLHDNAQENSDSSLAFTFLGMLITYGLSLVTVWMGLQLEPLHYLLIGWIDGFVSSKPEHFYQNQVEPYQRKLKKLPA